MTRSHFNTNVPYLEFPWSATFHWKLMTSDHDIFKMFDGILKMAPLCIMLEDRPIWKQRVHAQVLLFYWSQAMHVALHLRQLFWKCCSCCVIYWAMYLCKSNISFQVSILFSCITSMHALFGEICTDVEGSLFSMGRGKKKGSRGSAGARLCRAGPKWEFKKGFDPASKLLNSIRNCLGTPCTFLTTLYAYAYEPNTRLFFISGQKHHLTCWITRSS